MAQQIADLLQRAKAIGQAHASDETQESHAWGGKFTDAWVSAWDIVQNFVDRMIDWIGGQDDNDLDESDIEAEVESLADTVGDAEIGSAIEQAVLDELVAQGALQVAWYCSPGACVVCLENEAASPIPAGETFPSGDKCPQCHNGCQCSVGLPK